MRKNGTLETTRKAVAIKQDDLAQVAKQGVERALAARQTFAELSADELDAVNGGYAFPAIDLNKVVFKRPPILVGGLRGPFVPGGGGLGGPVIGPMLLG